MDFSLTEAERDLVHLCREFAQKEIAVRAPAAWEEARCPTDLLRDMGALGLLGMLVPEEWGGIGMSTVGFVAAMEQLGLADQSVAAAWQAHVTIGSLPLYLFGDDAQQIFFTGAAHHYQRHRLGPRLAVGAAKLVILALEVGRRLSPQRAHELDRLG